MRVALYNNYLGTFGGGEKVTFAMANALSNMGYSVDVITHEARPPSEAQIREFFGPGHDGFNVVTTGIGQSAPLVSQERALTEALRPHSVLINQCAGSSFRNPCPLGIYSVMFPFQDGGEWVQTYDRFVCNSKFTEFYTRKRWGETLSTHVLYPGYDAVQGDEGKLDLAAAKRREILCIGRFNPLGHQKNQRMLIQAFEKLVYSGLSGWRLVLLGKVNDGAESAVEEMQRAARHLPIDFELNATMQTKLLRLRQASIYWHATGMLSVEPEGAAKMEHFGIAVIEAMGFGCAPVCFGRAGPTEIIEHGRSGFLFEDEAQLLTFTRLLGEEAPLLRQMQAAAHARSQVFSRRAFDRGFSQLINTWVRTSERQL